MISKAITKRLTQSPRTKLLRFVSVTFLMLCIGLNNLQAQDDITIPTEGQKVPAEVESLFANGLAFLAKKQNSDGTWPTSNGFGSDTAGVTAICTMAFLAADEDPNFGKYALQIRKGLRSIIRKQHPKTGLFKGNTYDFGFAMLALAEAYGAVDDKLLWSGEKDAKSQRTIGDALQLCVGAAIVPEKRKGLIHRSWYSTGSSPGQGVPDTSVAGSVMVGLLASRNAGVAVPDSTIEKAVSYFEFMTNKDGTVGYMSSPASAYGNSLARSSIVTLVLSISKRKDSVAYIAARDFLKDNLEKEYDSHVYYGRYYMAQALFQSDYPSWIKWNESLISRTRDEVNEDGSIGKSAYGKSYSTGISLLSLGLNYRLLPIYER